MNPAFAQMLSFALTPTNIEAQKIVKSLLRTYKIVSTSFSLQNSCRKVRFFEQTYFLTDTYMEIVLGMLFLLLSNADIKFDTEKLSWRTSIIAEAMLMRKKVELMNKFEFIKPALNKDAEIYIVYITTLEIIGVHL